MDDEKVIARRKQKREWLDNNMESLNISLRQGTKAIWKSYAAQSGMPLVRFIEAAIEEKAERDGLIVEVSADESNSEE